MGRNPKDRGKNGAKKSVLVDGDGGPLGVVIEGANVPDSKLLRATIEAIVIERPEPTAEMLNRSPGVSQRQKTCPVVADAVLPRQGLEHRRDSELGKRPRVRPMPMEDVDALERVIRDPLRPVVERGQQPIPDWERSSAGPDRFTRVRDGSVGQRRGG